MAKHSLSSKQFFTMTVLSVSVLGLILVTTQVQKPTNTRSNAAYDGNGAPPLPDNSKNTGGNNDSSTTGKSSNDKCTKDPGWTLTGTTDNPTSVVYHLRLKDNCPGENDYLMSVNTPSRGHWGFKFANGNWGENIVKYNVGNNAEVNLTITRSSSALAGATTPPGKYNIILTAKKVNNSNVQHSINLGYTVN